MFIFAPLLSLSIVTADVQIQDVVPDTTIAFVSIPNVSKLVTSLKEAGVCDTVSSVVTTICEEQGIPSCFEDNTQCSELFDVLGIDQENWTPPNGYAGFAIYPVIDYEVNSVGIGAIGMIELDSEIYSEMFSKKYEEYIQTLEVETEIVQLSDRDVWMIQTTIDDDFQIPQFNFAANTLSQCYLVYSDGYLLISTEPEAIAAVFSAIDGDTEKDALVDNADYAELVDRCGEDGDIFAGVLLTNLADMVVQLDQSGMAMMFLPTIKTLIGDIDGLAESISFSPSTEVFIEAKYTALMNDGRTGVLGLLGTNATQQPIPNFVQPDAISYSQGQIDLKKVVPLIKETIRSNPMLGMQMGTQMEQMEEGIGLFLNPLGTTYHSYSTGQLPFTPESVGYLIAIECTDEEAFRNVLNMTLPSMGVESSDFLGNQIFTIDLGVGLPIQMPIPMNISISVAGGYAFFGLSNTVEEALRSIANPKDNKSTPPTNTAFSLVNHDDVSSWGYADLRASMEIQTAMSDAMANDMFDEMESFDPEMAAEMRREYQKNSAMQTLISNTITALFGPMSWNVITDASGFNAHVIMLKPAPE